MSKSVYLKLKFITIGIVMLFFTVGNLPLFGQSIANEIYVEGKVLDEFGKPIEKVSIVIEGASRTIYTDNQGYFSLTCPANTISIRFKHIAYKPYQLNLSSLKGKNGKYYHEVHLQIKSEKLEAVTVISYQLNTDPSLETIKEQHKLIAGGTSVAVMTPEVQRLETIKDALKYEPGVIIQEFFGANDQPRLSIRGSGIQSNPQRRGVYLLQDGIPVNFADGSFIIGVMDPAISESIEVFKGANALRYGAASLGGAINFNSRTGRQTQGIQLKTESGSFGYIQGNVMMGNRWNKTDAFLSVSGSRQDGFRRHNENKKINVAANIGYRFSDNIDSRLYLNYSYINFDISGPLAMAMLREDPTQINQGTKLPFHVGPNVERDQPGRKAEVLRFANRTAFRLSENTDLTVAAYYQLIQDRFVFPIALSVQRSTGNDFGFSIQAVHRMRKGTLTAGILESNGKIDRRGHVNLNGQDADMFSKDDLNAVNLSFYAEYLHRFNERLHLIGNIQAVNNKRNSDDVFPNPERRPRYNHTTNSYSYFASQNQSLDQQFKAFSPRIGAIYNAGKNKDFQFFGNLSASYEPPTFDDLVGTKAEGNINASPKEFFAIKLKKQSAYTAEIGTRQESSRYGWNLSLYHSWVKNELLEFKDFVQGIKNTQNYPKTIHQGIELGALAVPFEGIFTMKDKISVRAMYTYSNFYFKSGNYESKKLAGIPPHYLAAALEYKNPGNIFLALNVESQPQKSAIDHMNTVYQPTFTIFGFRAGIEGWKKFSLFVEGKNMLNKYYASSYHVSDQVQVPSVPFPEFTIDNIAFSIPGQTRAFYAGLTYKF